MIRNVFMSDRARNIILVQNDAELQVLSACCQAPIWNTNSRWSCTLCSASVVEGVGLWQYMITSIDITPQSLKDNVLVSFINIWFDVYVKIEVDWDAHSTT